MRSRILFTAILLLMAAATLAGAAPNPRARLSQGSDGQYSADDTRAEVDFGREVAARVLGRFPLLEEKELTRYINLVGAGLAAAGGREDLEFKFAVLNTDIPNAFATPGGYVFITKGALTRMKNEAELSAVLAHEIAHVSRRHIVRELNIKSSGSDVAGGLARVISGVGDVSRVAMGKMVDLAEEILFTRGYALDDENQADRDAVALVGAFGYDPGGLLTYLERTDKTSGREPASVKATHPAWAERKSRIETTLAADGLDKTKGQDMKERFDENVKLR